MSLLVVAYVFRCMTIFKNVKKNVPSMRVIDFSEVPSEM